MKRRTFIKAVFGTVAAAYAPAVLLGDRVREVGQVEVRGAIKWSQEDGCYAVFDDGWILVPATRRTAIVMDEWA